MISGKDITIDKEGSIILNGDKYPLASQAEIDAVKDDIDGIGDTIGDITQTGVTGADVATQIGTINNAIGGHNYAVFSKPLTSVSVDTAWGNMYESSLINIDITSLGLTAAPLAVFLGVVDAGSSVLFELSSTTKDAINFRLTRPTSVTIPSVTVTALVIY